MADSTNLFQPPRQIKMTLAPGAVQNFDGPGMFARFTALTGPINISFDDGSEISAEVGQAFQCLPGDSFFRVTVSNPATAAAAVDFTLIVGRMKVADDRVHIDTTTTVPVEQTDPNFAVGGTMDSTPQTAAAAAGVLLVGADATRREIWLWTDEPTNAAWFAESLAQLAAPLDFQRIGVTIEGFTKLRTRSAIYVKAANGVKIGAIVFKA